MKEILALLRQTERLLQTHARQIRLARTLLEQEASSKGALGSRGLTQFVLEHLEFSYPRRFGVTELQRLAQLAGYAAPSPSDLTKRLSAYARRTGNVDLVKGEGWRWIAGEKAEGEEKE